MKESYMAGIPKYKDMLVDGHTHTELCPHGTGDRTALMIERAIERGLDRVCITEHAPMPPHFEKDYVGDPLALTTAALSLNQVEEYMDHVRQLQRTYKDRIHISLGFEVDYIPGYEVAIRDFLDEYGPHTADNILSVHVMPGENDGFWFIDYSAEEFERGFHQWMDQPQTLYYKYFFQLRQAVVADLGRYTPQRIGHFDAIKRYQHTFSFPTELDEKNKALVLDILHMMAQQGRHLDYNMSGLYKKGCEEVYPSPYIQGMAYALGIPYVIGSDAHGVERFMDVWTQRAPQEEL